MVKNYWLAVLWNVVVVILSLVPSSDLPDLELDLIPHADKIVHFVMYVLLTFLYLQQNQKEGTGKSKIMWLILTVLYAFFTGFFLELIQNSFLIGRNFDIFDVLANTAGILVAVVFYKMFHHLKGKKWTLS